nr:hypothetical protein [Tanacetum cinerariifolium]
QLTRPQVNQAPVYQAPIPQTQRVSQTDFESYVKANDAILRNMQIQGQSMQNQCQNIQNQYQNLQNLQNQMATLTDMMSKLVNANTALSSRSGTLPGNTVTNLKEELKGITTRSGVAYQGPKTPAPSKQGTKVTKDQVQTPSSQNTLPVQPSVIQSESQASDSEPVVAPVSAPTPNLKPSILYPSRRDNEKHRKRFSVRAKETTGWIPNFDEQEEDNSESEDEQSIGFIKEDFDGSDVEKEGDNNVSMVLDSVKEDVNVQAKEKGNDFDVNNSLYPFELYPLLKKKKNVEEKMDKSNGTVSIPFPPGFTH